MFLPIVNNTVHFTSLLKARNVIWYVGMFPPECVLHVYLYSIKTRKGIVTLLISVVCTTIKRSTNNGPCLSLHDLFFFLLNLFERYDCSKCTYIGW